jgi:hypothetical protein
VAHVVLSIRLESLGGVVSRWCTQTLGSMYTTWSCSIDTCTGASAFGMLVRPVLLSGSAVHSRWTDLTNGSAIPRTLSTPARRTHKQTVRAEPFAAAPTRSSHATDAGDAPPFPKCDSGR